MHKYKLYSAVLRIGKNFVEDFAVILCLSIMSLSDFKWKVHLDLYQQYLKAVSKRLNFLCNDQTNHLISKKPYLNFKLEFRKHLCSHSHLCSLLTGHQVLYKLLHIIFLCRGSASSAKLCDGSVDPYIQQCGVDFLSAFPCFWLPQKSNSIFWRRLWSLRAIVFIAW